jgi:hypothetical protein
MESVFSTRSVPISHKQGQLAVMGTEGARNQERPAAIYWTGLLSDLVG